MNDRTDHGAHWRRSSFCADNACAEVAVVGDAVMLRNSSRPSEIASFTRAEWRAFLNGAVNREFNV